jgi:hypothetical protein
VLANLSHTHVTSEIWEQIKGCRSNLYRSEPDAKKKRSTAYVFSIIFECVLIRFSLYQAVMHRFRNRTACVRTRETCAPVLRQMRHEVS